MLTNCAKSIGTYIRVSFRQYDTAPNYGNGFSEFALGNVFSKKGLPNKY